MEEGTLLDFHTEKTIYIADTNMIAHYLIDFIPCWTTIVNSIKQREGSIYVLPRCAEEFAQSPFGQLPAPFKLLQSSEAGLEEKVEHALTGLKSLIEMDWETTTARKLTHDLKMLLEAGWYVADYFSWEVASVSQIVLITNNLSLARKMLSTPKRRQSFEIMINATGLEHFIEVWTCDKYGGVKKFFT
eukprot:TRINITY_DN12613_c0_g1_i1.p1 TRINITY_DN12613_c0_g1~~TRINITY_DN12613_c0_g1_i1.p1  ORF type:complete len:188 (+),score=27.14 TRINITY_DN12613_c0_g1_i1:97-660(+)